MKNEVKKPVTAQPVNKRKKRTLDTRTTVLLGLFAAIAFVSVTLIEIPVIPAVPFLMYEPKDIIVTIAGFIYGPFASFIITVVVALIEMFTISNTGFIGLCMNVLSTGAFVLPAALIYKKKRTLAGAVIGLTVGSLCMVLVMVLWNYIVTPSFMGLPRPAVVELLPAISGFNIVKAVLNSAGVMLIYKPITTALRHANLIPKQDTAKTAKMSKNKTIATVVISLFILASVIVGVLALQGKL